MKGLGIVLWFVFVVCRRIITCLAWWPIEIVGSTIFHPSSKNLEFLVRLIRVVMENCRK